MFLMSSEGYGELVYGARELERDAFGVKVLLLPDARIVKLFRIKRWFSSALIYPYSLRFQRNANRLRRMGIPAPRVERLFYCHSIRRHGVVYPMLQGETLEKAVQEETRQEGLFQLLAEFIALLHKKGIYFRSLHLGNVLLLPDGDLGLIDVADMRFSRSPLRLDQRRRNFRHLFRTSVHRHIFQQLGMERFLGLYIKAAALSQGQADTIRRIATSVQEPASY